MVFCSLGTRIFKCLNTEFYLLLQKFFLIGRITLGFLSRVCAEIGFQELQRKFIAEKSLKPRVSLLNCPEDISKFLYGFKRIDSTVITSIKY